MNYLDYIYKLKKDIREMHIFEVYVYYKIETVHVISILSVFLDFIGWRVVNGIK